MSTAPIYATYPSLVDQVVLITGGASGIGAATVEQFALQGARVAFLDVADKPALALIEDLTPRCKRAPLYHHCDLTNIESLQAAIATITEQLGTPRVLINNAANDDRHRFEDVTAASWDTGMAANLRHQFFAAQAVAPNMKAAGGGSIINMSSISWMIPTQHLSVYVTAKAAIVGMTRSMAKDLGPANIRVNAVLPGAILTEKQQRLYMSPEYEQELFKVQFLKRHILPDEVSRLLLFLAADDSSAITSQNYIIDAGWM
ncbi:MULTISPECIES: SDR family NAD(P)-dependent oxidoreductase [Acidobacteriaceae]|uniref:SDR family NAD(P)-dependent oxidoreductase n=1 Tax=Acidobacteriaceae TaxID=204434 RepID=UPI00131CFDC6|nr:MULTISPECIES: SDR family oxidoreductase [Acidobacteriaceae]MDW5265203.1 SDR family oxidoreductase [Edaphobacter sp.]